MSFFEFPHTRTYDSDLGWLIKHFKTLTELVDTLNDWKSKHEPEYEDLYNKVEGLINNLVDVIVPWDSSIAYHIFSIVEYQGTNYIAVQDVPVGVMITNTDYWQPAQTAIEQINAIGVVTSETAERLDASIPFVTPEEYGAVGDGTTDDTTAIQAAMNTGMPVYFSKKKVYRITNTLTISTVSTLMQKIVGNGASLLCDFDGVAITIDGTGTFAYRTHFEISGLTLKKADSPNASYTANNSTGIKLIYCANTIFRDIYINGFYHGIEFHNSLVNSFYDVTINNGYCALYMAASDFSGMNDTNFYSCIFITQTMMFDHAADNYIGHNINFYGCQIETITCPENKGCINVTSAAGAENYSNLMNFVNCWIEQCKPIFIYHTNTADAKEQFFFIGCRVISTNAQCFVYSTATCNVTLIATDDPSIYSGVRLTSATSNWESLMIGSGADGLSRRWNYMTRDFRQPKIHEVNEVTFKTQGSTVTHTIKDNGNYLDFVAPSGSRGYRFDASYDHPIFAGPGQNLFIWFYGNHIYAKSGSRPTGNTDGTVIF